MKSDDGWYPTDDRWLCDRAVSYASRVGRWRHRGELPGGRRQDHSLAFA
jgi:hypothetical protein